MRAFVCACVRARARVCVCVCVLQVGFKILIVLSDQFHKPSTRAVFWLDQVPLLLVDSLSIRAGRCISFRQSVVL